MVPPQPDQTPSIADSFLEMGGWQLAYRDKGQGQVILCLHALGHSSKDFQSLYSFSGDRFRVISVDFPGHGRSGANSEPASSLNYHRVIERLLGELGLANLIVVGNSIGGAVAMRLAAGNRQVKMLSLSNPSGLDKRGILASFFLGQMIRFFRSGEKGEANFGRKFARYYKKVLPAEEARDRRNEIVNDGYRNAPLLVQGWTSFRTKEEDLRSFIDRIHCPVLFTWAMKDRYVQLRRNIRSIKAFRNHTLIQYPIGHTPYLECPKIFLKDLLQYIDQVSPQQK